MADERGVTRLAVTLLVIALSGLASVVLFVIYPQTIVDFLGVLAVLGALLVGVKVGGSVSRSFFPSYDVAEVAVDGPITRDGGGGPVPSTPRGTPADDIVEQIDRANDEEHVDALILKLNTPGGEVVPSDDIRLAAERFDGPTVAYTTDVCASGGYWIASGCDELWAREASIVGSIGVIGSRVNATGLAEKLGLSYEGFTAGEYKDAGVPLKEMDEDERAYLQGLIDDYYDHFVDRVSEGRDVEPAFVRETEARVYLGETAAENGLVDELGTREDVEKRVATLLEREEITLEEYTPPRSLMQRVGTGAQHVAYAFGAGVTSVVGDREFRLRT